MRRLGKGVEGLMWINSYATPDGPHYSRPYKTLEEAVYARRWFEDYLAASAKTLPPHTFTGTIRVVVKDPRFNRFLRGGPSLFSGGGLARKATKPVAPRPDHPPGYVNATELCSAAGRPWSRYWETKAAFLNAVDVAHEMNCTPNELVHTVRGGDVRRQGTWVHPRIAEHLQAWLGLGMEDAA